MGILGNNSVYHVGVHRPLGTIVALTKDRDNSCISRMRSNDGASAVRVNAYPVGAMGSSAWLQPQTVGDMAMRPICTGGLAGSLVPSRPMSIDITGSGGLSGPAALVVSLLCAMAGDGTLAATINGQLNATCDLTGSGSLTAQMDGFAHLIADLLGSGDLDATVAAFGNMDCDIVVTGTGLSTANVAQAIWGALASAFTDPGTMGAKLNAAASGGIDLGALADAMLGRNLAGGADGGRTVRDALRASRNRVVISGNTLTVYAEDDTTVAWTATITTAQRDALQGVDPA